MVDDPIVFIDSGIGGLLYLEMVREYMPEENFVYVADNKNFPYGEKKTSDLEEIVINLIKNIVAKISPKLIVIACNTASVVALSILRKKFGIPFVGVVPAIKPAGEYFRNGSIGLLATRQTVKDSYIDRLISAFASTCMVVKYAGIDLVEFIETEYLTSTDKAIMKVVSESAKYFSSRKIDSLVLGCTHFVYLKDYFKRSLGDSVDIFDSREGVSKQVRRIIKNRSLMSLNKTMDIFYVTGSEASLSNYLQFAGNFDLKWGGIL